MKGILQNSPLLLTDEEQRGIAGQIDFIFKHVPNCPRCSTLEDVIFSVPTEHAPNYACLLRIGLEAIRRGEEYAIYNYKEEDDA